MSAVGRGAPSVPVAMPAIDANIDTNRAADGDAGLTRSGTDPAHPPRYQLRLYVTGSTPRSLLAIQNIQHICQKYLEGAYDLEVVDIYRSPEVAAQAQIIAAPTLIRLQPEPPRRTVGDLSDEEKVLIALNISRPGSHEP